MKRAALAAVAALALSISANAQDSQMKCGPRAGLVAELGQKYHEVPIAIGMISQELIMETFASDQGTWTMFLTNKDRVSCVVADGVDWNFDTAAFDAAKKKGPKA